MKLLSAVLLNLRDLTLSGSILGAPGTSSQDNGLLSTDSSTWQWMGKDPNTIAIDVGTPYSNRLLHPGS